MFLRVMPVRSMPSKGGKRIKEKIQPTQEATTTRMIRRKRVP